MLVTCWSDGIVCRFPAGQDHARRRLLQRSSSASAATSSVRCLAYQKAEAKRAEPSSSPAAPADEAGGESPSGTEASYIEPTPALDAGSFSALAVASPRAGTGWDPGAITDDELISHFRRPAILGPANPSSRACSWN